MPPYISHLPCVNESAVVSASAQRDINLGRLSFNAYTSLQGHVYDYQNAIVFIAGGSATFYFNDQWSMTAFG